MPDVFSPKTRSTIMSRIKGRDTNPERIVRSIIHRMGYRFRLHAKELPGKPDIVLPKHKKLVFVNGCFWHGHKGCKRAKIPATNTTFWLKKINSNIARDKKKLKELKKLGWKPLVVWQCQLRDKQELTMSIRNFLS